MSPKEQPVSATVELALLTMKRPLFVDPAAEKLMESKLQVVLAWSTTTLVKSDAAWMVLMNVMDAPESAKYA